MTTTRRLCLECGCVFAGDSQFCSKHRRENPRKKNAWKRQSEQARAQGSCTRCGSRHRLELHHKVSVAMGGTNHHTNTEVLCQSCHKQETARQRAAGEV